LTEEQFVTFKKGVQMQLSTETKCRKCKRVITTTIQTEK
jgi:hypothetical protein